MFSITISSDDTGKSVGEILERVRQTEVFKQQAGSQYSHTSCIVTLDDIIIPYSKLNTAIAYVGQNVKVIHLVGGG